MSNEPFHFREPGPLVDGDLTLDLVYTSPAIPERGWVPAYHFEMRHTVTGVTMGHIDLRAGHTAQLDLCGGQIGYAVQPEHRGHRYAARSCRLLFGLAEAHALSPLWITCNPDNWASRRTCELAGGLLIEVVDTPPDSEFRARGETLKCRYRFDLS